MPSYLLDTNVLSELLRPTPSRPVIAFLSTTSDLWLSVVVLHEISFGATRLADAGRRQRLEDWLQSVRFQYKGRMVGIDESIAEAGGRLRGYAASRGRVLAPLDSLVAATAITRSHVLATRNIRDFAYLEMNLHDPWADEARME